MIKYNYWCCKKRHGKIGCSRTFEIPSKKINKGGKAQKEGKRVRERGREGG